jgi:hypothetical protein
MSNSDILDDGTLQIAGVEEAEEAEETPEPEVSPEEFFAKHAFRVIYQTNNFFLPQVKDLVIKGDILNIRPEYQRRLRWTTVQKSRLIESLLLNIPVPPVFLYETSEARYEVMDGQQRLNAIKEYLEGDFVLTGVQALFPLNGIRYSKAPPRIKRALDRASLSAIVLLLESDGERSPGNKFTISDIRRFIFDRLNTGGTKLNAQEIRNAIYPGEFNKAIIDLTRNTLFTEIFGIPPYVESDPNDYYENPARQKNTLYATMGDCQLVLRYFALRDSQNIRGAMKSMLDRAMEKRTDISRSDGEQMETEYLERLSLAQDIFGPKLFRLPPDEKGHERVSAALYDATMVALHQLWEHRAMLKERRQEIRARLKEEFAKEVSTPILTGYGNTAKAVRDRIDLMEKILKSGAGI